MGTIRGIINYFSGGQTRNHGVQSAAPSVYGQASATPVTAETSMQLSAVWACNRLITEAIAGLPIHVYDILPDGSKKKNETHPIAVLFSNKINRWQTRQEFFETLLYQYVLLGNSYCAVQRNKQDKIIALVPLMTAQMEVDLQPEGNILFKYRDAEGLRVYSQDTIWHNKLFGNGIIGLSPLAHARNAIGVGQAAENSTTKLYSNGAKPAGILSIDHVLSEEQRAAIKKNFDNMSNGTESRLFVLEADMKYTQASLAPKDIQLLESRRFQIEDICRFFGVPSVLINDTKASTSWGSGIEQIIQGFYKFTLRAYMERIEASMMVNLLSPKERQKMCIEFDFNALLQPSRADRIKMGKEAVQGGLMTANEFRKMEGWTPMQGGDKLLVQQQMTNINEVDSEQGKAQ